MENRKEKKSNFYFIYIFIAIFLIGLYLFNRPRTLIEISRIRFEQIALANDIQKIIVVNQEFAEIYIKPDQLKNDTAYKDVATYGWVKQINPGPHYKYKFLRIESFEEEIKQIEKRLYEINIQGKDSTLWDQIRKETQVELISETRKNWFGDLLGWLIPIGLLVLLWVWFMRSMARGAGGGNVFNVGKSKAQFFDKNAGLVATFQDVAGLDEAKVEIAEVVDFLKNPKKYTQIGGKIPKGILLVGPPGTGKTLLARAVAGEANVPFFSISGSDFVELFVGVGASRVRDLFKQAKEKAPCIVFIDEIDAIGRARVKNPVTGANDERENTLNQLLTEMDGFTPNNGVIVLAATNRPDILDKALMRAGRFDRMIHIELPDLRGREDIFKVHLRPLKISSDVNPDFLARQTPGFSGADIANVCNEAALIAARKNKNIIDRQDFIDAIDRIVGGLEKRNRIISEEEKRIIAIHESGHASVSWLIPHAHPLVKVSIIPRGKALGAAWYLPEERQISNFDELFDEMTAILGGRAAEDVILGKVSSGAMNDLERVTKQAYAIITYLGMNPRIGNLSFYDSSSSQEYVFTKPYSEKTAQIIDEEVKNIVESAYQRAKEIVINNKEKIEQLANLLLQKEVIFRDDVEQIFGPRPHEKPIEKESLLTQHNK